MLNKDLLDKDELIKIQNKELNKLRKTIYSFKHYDEVRTRHYKTALERIKELESIISEFNLETVDGRNNLLHKYITLQKKYKSLQAIKKLNNESN